MKVPLLIAAAGAVVILLGFFSDPVEIGGLVAIALGTLISIGVNDAPEGPRVAGVDWSRLLGIGAVISVLAWPLALVLETIGGLLGGFGAGLVIVAVAFGYPRT